MLAFLSPGFQQPLITSSSFLTSAGWAQERADTCDRSPSLPLLEEDSPASLGLCLGSWMSLVCGEFKKPVLCCCLVTGRVSAWMGLEGALRPQGGVGGSWVAPGGWVRPGGDNRRGGRGRGKNPGPEFPAWPTLQTCLPSREAGAP